ncbi:MAG: aldehyde dehydrogenase family protein [Planctomycetes bacterium]|nr:aldehyde dehydrogenase family protein [Planctomycetota bacterium]
MRQILADLGLGPVNSGVCGNSWVARPGGGEIVSLNPSTGEPIATVLGATPAEYDQVVAEAAQAFESWRELPAPRRGEIVRQIGEELRRLKEPLGKLVSLEMGKILQEGLGEVQEMIDIADFAVGLSRQLYGLSMHSERPRHRMYEQWHPLGPVGVISAFNFPVAVWAWNALIAAACGDTVVWKPSSQTPLTAVAVQHLTNRVCEKNGLRGIFTLFVGRGSAIGDRMLEDHRIPLLSVTASTRVGKHAAKIVGERLGRTILELGGNNAIVVDESADLEMAARAILFGAVGTAGQRCTSTRRVIAHKSVAAKLTEKLLSAYKTVPIGDPLDPKTLMGPLIDEKAVQGYLAAIEKVKADGGKVLYGGKRVQRPGFFVEPTLVQCPRQVPIVCEETFAPILYLLEFSTLDEAIALQNGVPQGLSSAIFTNDLRNAERFLSAAGSDCGIANVNIGTSGAEIGGAFGGEKETGGGREAGSDSWKAYMRRQTCTINYSRDLPLAQGIRFGD